MTGHCRGQVDNDVSDYFSTKEELIAWFQIEFDKYGIDGSNRQLLIQTINANDSTYQVIQDHLFSYGCEPSEIGTVVGPTGPEMPLPTDVIDTSLPPKPFHELPANIPLKDPELELAKEWFIELNCDDMNVDCCEGIDQMQNLIKDLYDFIHNELLTKIYELEQKIATILTDINVFYENLISNIEYNINNLYQSLTLQNESLLEFIEDNIQKICNEGGIDYETKLQKDCEEKEAKCPDVTVICGESKSNGNHKPNNGEVESEQSPILQSCCEFPQPWVIKFDDSQLQDIVTAIQSISISPEIKHTTIQNAENVVCEEEYPSETSYELSSCFDKDVKAKNDREGMDTYIEKFIEVRKSKQPAIEVEY